MTHFKGIFFVLAMLTLAAPSAKAEWGDLGPVPGVGSHFVGVPPQPRPYYDRGRGADGYGGQTSQQDYQMLITQLQALAARQNQYYQNQAQYYQYQNQFQQSESQYQQMLQAAQARAALNYAAQQQQWREGSLPPIVVPPVIARFDPFAVAIAEQTTEASSGAPQGPACIQQYSSCTAQPHHKHKAHHRAECERQLDRCLGVRRD